MATIFVSKTGNDSTGTGSQGNPYLTIGKANTVATTSDMIRIRGGTYQEQNTWNQSGTALVPFTVMAHEDAGVREPVVIDGNNYALPGGASNPGGTYQYGTWYENNFVGLMTFNGSYVLCQGLKFQYSKGRGVEAEGLITAHTTNVTFRDLTVIHTRTSTVGVKYVDNVLVENVYTEDGANYAPFIRPTAGGQPNNHPAGVSFQVGFNLTVRNFTSKGHWGEGLMLNTIDGFLVELCWVCDMMSGNYYLHRAKNGTFRSNVGWFSDTSPYPPMAVGSAGSGVAMNNEDWRDDWGDRATYAYTWICANIDLYNNIMVACAPGFSILGGNTGAANQGFLGFSRIRHWNNTVIRPRDIGLRVGTQSQITNAQFINNAVHLGNFAGAIQTQFPNSNIAQNTRHHNAWSIAPEANAVGAGDVVGPLLLENPNILVSGPTGPILTNYVPKATSPIRNAGINLAGFTDDYYGDVRPSGAWSMGAIQYGGTAPPPPPPPPPPDPPPDPDPPVPPAGSEDARTAVPFTRTRKLRTFV